MNAVTNPISFNTEQYPGLQVTRLTGALGAEISGISLAETPTAALRDTISALLQAHEVLFFRNQPLNAQQHYDFARQFGDLHVHPIYPHVAERPEILILDTHGKNPPDAINWHSDVSCIERPPLGSILAIKHLPPVGGDTLWASATAAYDALSEPFKLLLAGLTAQHSLIHSFTEEQYARTPEERVHWQKAKDNNPPVSHPVIRSHPITGRKAIFVNEDFTQHINELSRRESDAVLQHLYRHISQPKFTVRWRWQPEDVVFWDNRMTQHMAISDYLPHRRIVHRATITGEKPF